MNDPPAPTQQAKLSLGLEIDETSAVPAGTFSVRKNAHSVLDSVSEGDGPHGPDQRSQRRTVTASMKVIVPDLGLATP
jgi:hypothetical protein